MIWLLWAFLWLLFFLLLGLKREQLTTYTGWVTAIEGWITAAIPALLVMTGNFGHEGPQAVVLAVLGVVVFAGLWPLTHGSPKAGSPEAGRPEAGRTDKGETSCDTETSAAATTA